MQKRTYHPSPLARVHQTVNGSRSTLVLTREISHDIGKVWASITDPEELRQWAPYFADRDLAAAGDVTIIMQGADDGPDQELPGQVIAVEPPRLLEHTFGPDVLRWELEAIPGGTRLRLQHTLDDSTFLTAVAAGWHICLDVADAMLAGQPFGPVVGSKAKEYGWDDLNVQYAQLLGVEPAKVW